MADEGDCALLVLAAGGSSRMGEPKQLLPIGDRPLIRHVVLSALEARFEPTVIVLGAHAANIRPHLADLPLLIVENPRWSEGMSGSLRVGLAAMLDAAPQIAGIIVMLADQPQLPATHLREIAETQRRTRQSIVASNYGHHLGPPAYFGREHFATLQALSGDVGARALLQTSAGESVAVPANAGIDLDTASDYQRLLESAPEKQ